MDGRTIDDHTPLDRLVATVRWILIAAGCAAAAPVVATLLLRQIAIATPWAVAYVAASPFVPFAGVIALALFLLARSWTGASAAAMLTAVLLVTQVPLYLGRSAPSGATTELTVMTINLHFGLGNPAEIVDTVQRDGVELLSVQELDHDALAGLRAAGLDDVLEHSVTRPDGGASGNGLWSRFPLEPLPRRMGFGHPPVAARMDLDERVVFVAAVHAVSPFPDDTERWSAELDELAEWLGEVDGLAVVAGDFNATFDHPQFRDVLATGFRDAAEQAGAGFLPTFPANRRRPLLITIDHVLVNDGIVATDVRRVQIADTDHEALVVTLAVRATEPKPARRRHRHTRTPRISCDIEHQIRTLRRG